MILKVDQEKRLENNVQQSSILNNSNEKTRNFSRQLFEPIPHTGTIKKVIQENKNRSQNENNESYFEEKQKGDASQLMIKHSYETDNDNDSDDKYKTPKTTSKGELPQSLVKQIQSSANNSPYLKELKLIEKSNKYYGAVKKDDLFYVGNYMLKLKDKNHIQLGKQNFPSSQGLINLLLMTNSRNYTQSDLEIYRQILQFTNAHRKGFNPINPIVRTEAHPKYKKIIKNIFPESTSGKGVSVNNKVLQTNYMLHNRLKNKINYIYWDNPNELVERLKLLVASKQAGHTGHDNEIISIIEELREANILT